MGVGSEPGGWKSRLYAHLSLDLVPEQCCSSSASAPSREPRARLGWGSCWRHRAQPSSPTALLPPAPLLVTLPPPS